MLIENIMLRGYLMHKIITFSKQALNESLDFLQRATRLEHRTHSPKVTLVLWLTENHIRVKREKQASCLLHWLSLFTLADPLFHFTLRPNRYYNYILNTKLFCFLDYQLFFIF